VCANLQRHSSCSVSIRSKRPSPCLPWYMQSDLVGCMNRVASRRHMCAHKALNPGLCHRRAPCSQVALLYKRARRLVGLELDIANLWPIMLPRPCGPLTRASRRSSHVSQPTQNFDGDDDGNWSTDLGYDGRHLAQQPSMSDMRDRLTIRPTSTSHHGAWESYGEHEASPGGYRSPVGPEGAGGQAVRWTQQRARVPVDPRPDPQHRQPLPMRPRHRHEPVSLRRQPSYDRYSLASNRFVPTGPIYALPEDPAYVRRLAQRFGPHTQFNSLQHRPVKPTRRRTETEPVREQGGQASRESQRRHTPDQEHRPQRKRPNPQRSEGDKVWKQEEITRMIREGMAVLLDEKLSQPRESRQHGGNVTAKAPSSMNNDLANAVAQIIIKHLQGNSNSFGDKPPPTSSYTSMQGPTYDPTIAYTTDPMQRNQFLSPAHQTQSLGLPTPGLASEGANSHLNCLELIRRLLTGQTQLHGMVHDLQKELQSFDGGSSTRSTQYAPPRPLSGKGRPRELRPTTVLAICQKRPRSSEQQPETRSGSLEAGPTIKKAPC